MDFELRMARQKLEREQRERKERAKLRQERERRAKAEAAGRRDALEAAQRASRLDAARAQELAEQELKENLLIGDGVIFSQTLKVLQYNGNGDKIKLPPSCFSELSSQGALDKGPMCFRLSRSDGSPSTTHSGVLEFTAMEGFVELPPHTWTNLFHGDEVEIPLVEVKYVSLPKGSYAKLQQEDSGFSDLPYHKAVLETALRQHTTLSQGDVIAIIHGGFTFKLRVLELKPSPCVSVIDTDMEVDIIQPEEKLSLLTPLEIGKAVIGTVDEGRFNYYKFYLAEHALGDANIEVSMEVDAKDGADTDLFVSRHPVVFPTELEHEWSCHDVGAKTLTLAGGVSGSYSIGVYGYRGQTQYKICVSLKEKRRSENIMEDEPKARCRNCGRCVLEHSLIVHEAFCARHNVLCGHEGCGAVLRKEEAKAHVHCDECGKGLRKEQLQKHADVFHRPIHCPCGAVFNKEEMERHRAAECPLRLITCRFCSGAVAAGRVAADARDRLRGLCEHESICGSRTAPCDACGRTVMLKDMDIHLVAVHQKS
ncbi:ubiquitin fusion degradation UFD1 family protein [Wolffia australiana]